MFCSYEIGYPIITAGQLQQSRADSHPVGACERRWHEKTGSQGLGRESWDLTTVLYAVRPDAGLWVKHAEGRIAVSETGITTWHAVPGRQSFLLPCVPDETVRQAIEELLQKM